MARKNRIEIEIGVDASQAARGIKTAESSFQRFTNFLKTRFVVTLGDVTRAVQQAFKLIEDSARLRGAEVALRKSLAAQGQAFDEYIAKLKEVSDNQISTADLIASSSKAIALGISAADIPALLERARAASIALGTDFTQAFDDIATGIGRASPLILDNLGIVVNLTAAYKEMADNVGKSAEELTKAEKQQALLNAVLNDGKDSTDAYIKSQDELSSSFNQASAQLSNFKTLLGDVGGALLLGFASAVARLSGAVLTLGRAFTVTTAGIADLASKLPVIGSQFIDAAEATAKFDERIAEITSSLFSFGSTASDAADDAFAIALGFKEIDTAASPLPKTLRDVQRATKEVAAESDDAKEATKELVEVFEEEVRVLPEVARVYEEVRQQLRLTTRAYDELRQSAGEVAALQGALQAGGTLVQGGTRLRLPGGGSRLVGSRSTFTTTGGTFTFRDGVRVRVDASGNILN